MIRVPARDLPRPVAEKLASWQREIDALPDHAARVPAAQRLFSSRNRADNPTFAEIRRTLAALASGAQRCMYCEDSCADEVEHIRPKHLYPDAVFVWANYLYACGPCNGPKGSRYPLLVDGNVQVPNGTSAPPPGTHLLIDPRREDPCEFLVVDILNTFSITPRYGLDPVARLRASETITLLRLNREVLCTSRRHAYLTYRALLAQYVQWSDAGRPDVDLDRAANEIRRMAHPTVWHEMQRLHTRIPELHSLFVRAPEALDWRWTPPD